MILTSPPVLLLADVDNAGTVAVPYPIGTTEADFTGDNASPDGYAILENNNRYEETSGAIALAYGADEITLTNNSGLLWPAGITLLVGCSRTFVFGGPGSAVVTGPSVPSIGGTMSATVDGTVADVPAAALATTDTYTDAAVNDALNAAISQLNKSIRELQESHNALLSSLRTGGAIGP